MTTNWKNVNETEKEIACTPSGGYHAQEHTELSILNSLYTKLQTLSLSYSTWALVRSLFHFLFFKRHALTQQDTE